LREERRGTLKGRQVVDERKGFENLTRMRGRTASTSQNTLQHKRIWDGDKSPRTTGEGKKKQFLWKGWTRRGPSPQRGKGAMRV